MKIGLKNIQYSAALSEETNAFTADIYIDGIKAAIASNSGRGGNTDILPMDVSKRDLVHKANEWCKNSLPDKSNGDGEQESFPDDLESYVDSLIDDYVNEKNLKSFRKKMEKTAKQGIVFGVADRSYMTCTFNMTIEHLLKSDAGRAAISTTLTRTVIPKMQPGDQILNTNIPGDILKAAGLK